MRHCDTWAIDPRSSRETVHDLRNLFSVAPSAGRLLERGDRGGHPAIHAALHHTAIDGGRLTTSLRACLLRSLPRTRESGCTTNYSRVPFGEPC